MGHMSRECTLGVLEKWRPARKKAGLKECHEACEPILEMDCSFVHSQEVEGWDRLMVTVWVAGKPLQATLDTGCSQTLIQAGEISKSVIEWCPPVWMHCIDGKTDQYERGFVNVRVAGRKGRLRIGLAPQLDGQLIVGRDWPPLYEVLEEVHMEELRHGRWPRGGRLDSGRRFGFIQ